MRKFFSTLKEKLEEDKKKEDGKPPRPSKPQASQSPAPEVPVDGLANSMGGMSLGERPPHNSNEFVGGFQCVSPSSLLADAQ